MPLAPQFRALRGRQAVSTLLALILVLSAAPLGAAVGTRTIIAPSGPLSSSNFGFSVRSAGDFNGDGAPDLIVGATQANAGSGAAYVYFGGPGADNTPDITIPGGPGDLLGACVLGGFDFNGDGYDDIAVAATLWGASDNGRVWVYYGGPGADNIAELAVSGAAFELLGHGLAAGDINGDGHDDLVIGAAYVTGRALLFLGGPGADLVADKEYRARGDGGHFGNELAANGDINHDGYADLIVGSPDWQLSTGRVEVFLGGAVPDTTADITIDGAPVGYAFGDAVAWIGDVNGDTFDDFAVGAPDFGVSSVGSAFVYYGGASPNGVADVGLGGSGNAHHFGWAIAGLGDLNRDGFADFGVGDYGYFSGSTIGRMYVYNGGPALDTIGDRFIDGPGANDQAGFALANLGDFDLDGGSETAIGAWQQGSGPGKVYVYDLDPDTLRAVRALTAIDGANGMCAGDFVEDGALDAAVASQGSGVRILKNRPAAGIGLGAFTDIGGPAITAAQDVAAGDFDSDGILDLVVSAGAGWSIHRGMGNGAFLAGVSGALASSRGVAVSDFNDDGIFDFAVAVFSATNDLRVFLGNGTGGVGNATFTAGVVLTGGANATRVLASDFNEDGITDLALSCQVGGVIAIFLGQGAGGVGDGTFAAPVQYAAGSNPLDVVAGDFNEDGIADLAVAGVSGVEVLLGQGVGGVGNGTFGAATLYAAGITTRELVAIDVTGDDRTDLVASSGNSDLIEVLAGNGVGVVGNGTFTTTTLRSLPDFPGTIIAGDFNQNGRADFLASAFTSDNVTFFTSDNQNAGERVHVTYPNGGEVIEGGAQVLIAWTQDPAILAVKLESSLDGGATWSPIAPIAYESPYRWTAPDTGSAASVKVRVRDLAVPNRSDTSDLGFTIHSLVAAPSVVAPGAVRFALASANPSTGFARVALDLPRAQQVSVDAYDVAGRRIATLAHGPLPAGRHLWALDGRALPPGVAFVRAVGEDFARSLRVVIVH